jgi:hypothetical protein
MRDSNSRGPALNTLSQSVGACSHWVSAVCDLELRPGPVLCGCSRTVANETRTETGVASVPDGFQERSWFTTRHRCDLPRRRSGMAR